MLPVHVLYVNSLSSSLLQGLLTNDVKQIYSSNLPIQYSAILNAHGRFLHDLFLYQQPGQPQVLVLLPERLTVQAKPGTCTAGNTPTILADVDKQGLHSLMKLLKRSDACVTSPTDPHMPQSSSSLNCAITDRYKLRAKVNIDDVSSDFAVWTRFGPSQFAEGQTSKSNACLSKLTGHQHV